MRSSGQDKGATARMAVAAGAFVLYIITEYVVLGFSRTREYHADRFSGKVTGRPASLASALVKIAYGLAGQDKQQETEEGSPSRSANLEAIGALGIFDSGAARGLAIASYGAATGAPGAVNKENLKGAMRWDLWNPWAKWYELNSTHPLIAKRLHHLSNQAVHLGQEPYVVFDENQPESYWDEFLVDISVHLLPLAAVSAVLLYFGLQYLAGMPVDHNVALAAGCIALGGAMLVKFGFSYRSGFFPPMSVAALLKNVKVSAVRPVPCALKGTIIGRGVPGYIFSEDFVMKDDTGIIFLDYRQPLAIWEWLFGLLKAGEFQGRDVEVQGWYRRSPVPYVELQSLRCGGKETKSWVPTLYRLSSFALLAAGAAIAILQPIP